VTVDLLKSGSVVQLISGGRLMRVVGYDSVGSVICEWPDGRGGISKGYIPRSLLTVVRSENSSATKGTSAS
jgi:uncharacterized protein YodC (DUF2158 family)